MGLVVRSLYLVHTVIDDQPAVPGQDGRSATANFEEFPWRDRSGQPVMRSKQVFLALRGHRAVRNPNALPFQIRFTRRGLAGSFLCVSAGKKRPVEDGQFWMSGRIGNGDRKEAGVFIVHVAEIDALAVAKCREPQALPAEEILRDSQGDSWASRRKRRVAHDVSLARFQECDSRIFATTADIGLLFIIGFRLQRDAEALDGYWVSGVIESHSRNTDARVVSLRHQPRKEIERAVRAASGSWIQDPFDLLRITGLRLHDRSQTLQVKFTHRISFTNSQLLGRDPINKQQSFG